jgi:hypothetical protein
MRCVRFEPLHDQMSDGIDRHRRRVDPENLGSRVAPQAWLALTPWNRDVTVEVNVAAGMPLPGRGADTKQCVPCKSCRRVICTSAFRLPLQPGPEDAGVLGLCYRGVAGHRRKRRAPEELGISACA